MEICNLESENLQFYYKEFINYIKDCEYTGCIHIKENKCGIKKSLEEGKISAGRYERYKKIYEKLKEKEKHKW